MKTQRARDAAAQALEKRPVSDWQKPAAVFAALAVTGAIAASTLHMVGDARHQGFLDFWRIDAGLFPQSTDRLLINGFYGAFERLIWMQNGTAWSAVSPIVGVFLLTLFTLLLLIAVFRDIAMDGKSSRSAGLWWEVRIRALRYFSFAVLVSILTYLLMALAMVFMIMPVATGDASARAQAVQLKNEYEKGCAASRYRCVEFLRNGESFAVGFVLESSPSHVALFDAALHETRVFERSGLEMRTRSNPKNR